MESLNNPEVMADDAYFMERSILNSPQPQATSTVNRRPAESLPLVPAVARSKIEPQLTSSPSYLLNAIDGMRLLSSQLGSLSDLSSDTTQTQTEPGGLIRRAVSIAALYDDRRESVAADSEANSSLGILKLDDCPGFSEAEDGKSISELLQNIRKETLLQPMGTKENQATNAFSKKMSLSNHHGESDIRRSHVGSNTSSKLLNSDRASSAIEADLRLRLQKALAQRTMDRSMDSTRMSLLSDSSNVGRASVSDDFKPINENHTKDIQLSSSNSLQTPSPASNATFGAANFMSFSGSPAVFDSISSETFQPADMALNRLKEDENSWRQHFDDLPAFKETDSVEPNVNQLNEHLTQNFDLSNMSGIIAGEVSVSSSIMEGIGKRRLSAGEYFKLHTERLGGTSEDERPNFGHSIRSPPKRRPHPPLINMDSTLDSNVDEVPTRDSGLNKNLNLSFPDTMNFSYSVGSEFLNCDSVRNSEINPSKSMELMPPPPQPKALPKRCASETRDSLSTRLSVSLSLPRDTGESSCKDLNSSTLSLDSGEKFVSISQMVKIMQDLPSGHKSARQLVDHMMQRCRIPDSKPEQEHGINECVGVRCISNQETKVKSHSNKSAIMDLSENSPSRNQRVEEWISTIDTSGHDSVLGSELEEVPSTGHDSRRETINTCSSADFLQDKGSCISNNERERCGLKENLENNHELAGLLKKQNDLNSEGNESVSSFMKPPGKSVNPTLTRLGTFSTPKVHHKRNTHVNDTHGILSEIQTKNELPLARRSVDTRSITHDYSSGKSRSSLGSEYQSANNQKSQSSSKHSSQSSSSTLKSLHQRPSAQKSDIESKAPGGAPDLKHCPSAAVLRPSSKCGSVRSMVSCSKSSSKQTDVASVLSGPLQIDSTHTQLSWSSVSPGSNLTQTFALRNKASARVRLLVSSPNAAFKLVGDRGEVLTELILTLHSEETRRIHVVFSPISMGSVVGKLVISRVATSENCVSNSEERRLIALYGYGGNAELAVEGASKDRWAQLFLNMCTAVESDAVSEISDVDVSHDALHLVSSFSVRNCGKVPAFISLQIAGELPFDDCGVYVAPKELLLEPGEVGRVSVRFDPGRDILQWLNKNAEDMQLLGNIWLSWSELATWQRIRRLYLKYYKAEKTGSLSAWGALYTGDIGVGQELKDNKSSEAVLAQAVRRLKVAVLIERERLNLFDLDATMVFDQLVANETAMFNSPQLDERTCDSSVFFDSPILAGMSNNKDLFWGSEKPSPLNSSPLSSTQSKRSNVIGKKAENELIVDTAASSNEPKTFSLEFPVTTVGHKSKVKITFQNPSFKRSFVSVSDVSTPFAVSTPKFYVPTGSYVTVSVLFKPVESGTHHSVLHVEVDGNRMRSYLLCGEGVHE